MQEKPVLTVAEVAEMLGVSKPTVYDLVEREDFNALIRIGRWKLILRHKFIEWLEKEASKGENAKCG
jgi:excisionase family DNA binding protein